MLKKAFVRAAFNLNNSYHMYGPFLHDQHLELFSLSAEGLDRSFDDRETVYASNYKALDIDDTNFMSAISEVGTTTIVESQQRRFSYDVPYFRGYRMNTGVGLRMNLFRVMYSLNPNFFNLYGSELQEADLSLIEIEHNGIRRPLNFLMTIDKGSLWYDIRKLLKKITIINEMGPNYTNSILDRQKKISEVFKSSKDGFIIFETDQDTEV